MFRKISRSCLVIMLAASVVFGGCGKKESKESPSSVSESSSASWGSDSVSEESGSKPAESSSSGPEDGPLPAPSVTPAEDPKPTPLPIPVVNHDGHSSRRELNCVKDKGMILGIFDAGEDRMLVTLFTNEKVFDEKNVEVGTKSRYCLIDTKNDSIVAEDMSISANETFIGTRDNGDLIFYETLNKKLMLYSAELKMVKEFPLENCRNIKYDSSKDLIYTVEGETMICLDMDGNKKTVLEKANQTDIVGSTYYCDKLLIKDPGYYSINEAEYSIFDTASAKTEVLFDREISDSTISRNTVIGLFYNDEMETVFFPYNYADRKEYEAFKSKDIFYKCFDSYINEAVFLRSVTENESTVRNVILVRPEDGSYAVIDDLNTYDVAVALDRTTEHIYLACTVYGPGSQENFLYEICPETLDYSEKFEKTEINKKSHTDSSCSERLKPFREQADKIEEKYGIRILIGDEVKDWYVADDYTIVSTDDITGEGADIVYESYGSILENLSKALEKYPEGFFDMYKDYRNVGGLRIFLVDDIQNNSGEFLPGGFAASVGCWSNIIVDIILSDESTFHHEIWHSIEEQILIRDPNALPEDAWMDLNPEGFMYGRDFESFSEYGQKYEKYLIGWVIDNKDPYFVRDYSTVNSKEDRATLFELIMAEDKFLYEGDLRLIPRECLDRLPHISAKLEFIQKYYEKWFGKKYW